jgi:hypothetical protein
VNKFLALLLLCLAPLANAATYYYSDCQAGADAACVAGDNARTAAQAQDPATPWQTFSATTTAAKQGGNFYLFARGGSWVNASIGLGFFTGTTSKCSTSAPCTFGAYTPSWGAVGSATVTMSIASPAVITWTGHGLTTDSQIICTTTGAFAKGFEASTTYFVIPVDANTFEISRYRSTATDQAGWKVNTSGSQSGTHTCNTGQAPILTEARAATRLFTLNDSSHLQDGGYIFRDMDLRRGAGTGTSSAFFLYDNVDDVLVENVEISGFSNGFTSQDNPQCTTACGAFKWTNSRVTLRNSYLHDNTASGWLGGAEDLLIENNYLDRNGVNFSGDHQLYLSTISRGVVRGNIMIGSVPLSLASATANGIVSSAGKCGGSVIVVHGWVDDLLIENNVIRVPALGAIPQCYGIEISQGYTDNSGAGNGPYEQFHRVVVRGNDVDGVGYVGFGMRGCRECVLEGNKATWLSNISPGNQCMSQNMNAETGNDETGTAWTVRNNSCYMGATSAVSTNQTCLRLTAGQGTNHNITNNLCYFTSAAPATSTCWDISTFASSDFVAFNNNLCSRGGAVPNYASNSATFGGRPAWMDANGVSTTDPLFVATPDSSNGFSLAVQAGSAAVNAGHATYKARLTIGGLVPSGVRDIGAYDSGASDVAPTGPGRIGIQ